MIGLRIHWWGRRLRTKLGRGMLGFGYGWRVLDMGWGWGWGMEDVGGDIGEEVVRRRLLQVQIGRGSKGLR